MTVRCSGFDGLVAGVDEAGRGPLAGPVVAAAVVLDPARPIIGLADSKTLGEAARKRLEEEIRANSLCWAVARASVDEIDRLNILQATLLAMSRAVRGLSRVPDRILVDGDRVPKDLPQAVAVIGGDAREAAISAASIVAKQARDRWMCEYDVLFPGYGFARHKGYGTRVHLAALARLGVTPIHRKSFAPVRNRLPPPELL